MSVRLYIGNLPKELERQELEAVFAEAGDSVSTKLVTDRKTGKCRGFGFVTVPTDEEADAFIEKFNGYVLKEVELKIEKALPRSKGKGEGGGEGQSSAPTGGGNNKAKSNKSGGGNRNRQQRVVSSGPDTFQPDPRWAQDLEKLKQLLAAQANS